MTEKALRQLESYVSHCLTKGDTHLFPNEGLIAAVVEAVDISPFVRSVIEQQAPNCVAGLVAMGNPAALDFNQWLREQVEALFYEQPPAASVKVNSPSLRQLERERAQDTDDSKQAHAFRLSYFNPQYAPQHGFMAKIRSFRRCSSAQVAILELSQKITTQRANLWMSLLADKMIQLAYQWSYASVSETFGVPLVKKHTAKEVVDQPAHLLILAMGKLGGQELNFSSDVDLIFFYCQQGQTQGGRRQLECSQFFNRVAILLIRLLDEITADGFVFRVDMRLRPYGDSGHLVISVGQAEDYYHLQGRDWERFAMVRARLITGSDTERRALQQIIKPFAFRRYIDYGVIDSLRSMKKMIQQEVRRRGLKDNIKLGAGGIREIEFMVQSLQLIRGGRVVELQQPSVWQVLPLIAKEKLLDKKTSQQLAKNYQFLRKIENIIQIFEEKQTQNLPIDPEQKNHLFRLMGYESWHKFYTDLGQILDANHKIFNSIFGESNASDMPVNDFYTQLWLGQVEASKFGEKIAFNVTTRVEDLLKIIADFRRSTAVKNLTTKGNKRLNSFMPLLLEKALLKDCPLQVLKRLFRLLHSILKRTAYLDLLSENKPLLDHLIDLISQSDWIAKRLTEYPILLDELLYPKSLYHPLSAIDLSSELQQKLLRIELSDEELLLDTIREFKQINELRVAAALLSKGLNISQVSLYLSEIADVIVTFAYQYCLHGIAKKYALPELLYQPQMNPAELGFGFAIVAYGKLGGRELGFNSDLDLVFLYDEKQHQGQVKDQRVYTRLAQKIIHFLSTNTRLGILYEVDMRLRPSGNSGLLVSHIDAFDEYQQQQAWTWEHQAIVRARPIVGHLDLCEKFEIIRNNAICQHHEKESLANDVSAMREKMRRQLERKKQHTIDLKQCAGGLVDIEFITQYLTLTYACELAKAKDGQHQIPSNNIQLLKAINKLDNLHNVGLNSDCLDQLIYTYSSYLNEINQSSILNQQSKLEANIFVNERKKVITVWQKLFTNDIA